MAESIVFNGIAYVPDGTKWDDMDEGLKAWLKEHHADVWEGLEKYVKEARAAKREKKEPSVDEKTVEVPQPIAGGPKINKFGEPLEKLSDEEQRKWDMLRNVQVKGGETITDLQATEVNRIAIENARNIPQPNIEGTVADHVDSKGTADHKKAADNK